MPNGSSAAGFQNPAEFLDSAAKKPAQGMRLCLPVLILLE